MSRPVANHAEQLFDRARGVLAGGVSASMRTHPYLGRPFYQSRGDGASIYDLDGKRYLDFNMSNGAALLGHGHPAVEQAVMEGLRAGIITAAETPYHEQLAAELAQIIPSAERVRFASTGTEVTTVAVRLARHATGRSKILKFDGHFHGLAEPFLFSRVDPSEPGGCSVPTSGGVPAAYGNDVIVIPWNDRATLDTTLNQHAGQIAAVILEPVHYNAGCILPETGYLALLRQRTADAGIVLIFDEILSGFRMALGGVQEYSGITPDLCTLAKAVANGLPFSVLAGRADLMEQLGPGGPVAHSGTYSGHLLSVLAALATIRELRRPGIYERRTQSSTAFYRDLQDIFDRHRLPVVVQGLGARFGLYFGRCEPVTNYVEALGHDHALHQRFIRGCLEGGLYFHAYIGQGAPGHAGFSLAHTAEDFATTLTTIDAVTANLA